MKELFLNSWSQPVRVPFVDLSTGVLGAGCGRCTEAPTQTVPPVRAGRELPQHVVMNEGGRFVLAKFLKAAEG